MKTIDVPAEAVRQVEAIESLGNVILLYEKNGSYCLSVRSDIQRDRYWGNTPTEAIERAHEDRCKTMSGSLWHHIYKERIRLQKTIDEATQRLKRLRAIESQLEDWQANQLWLKP